MSVVKFNYRSLPKKEVDEAIREGKGQYLCSGGNYKRFYVLNNSIVAVWEENPDNQFYSDPRAGELKLDDFLDEIKRIRSLSDKDRENVSKIISENEAAIREREFNRELDEAKYAVNSALNYLTKVLNT